MASKGLAILCTEKILFVLCIQLLRIAMAASGKRPSNIITLADTRRKFVGREYPCADRNRTCMCRDGIS